MQNINRLWQIVNAASTVRDLTQQSRTYHYAVTEPLTFYLRLEDATLQVVRWSRPLIELTIKMQGAFGWRMLADQDDAGVYVAAKRRSVVGGMSTAMFEVRLPFDTYVMLQLDRCTLNLNNISGEVRLPPPDEDDTLYLTSGS